MRSALLTTAFIAPVALASSFIAPLGAAAQGRLRAQIYLTQQQQPESIRSEQQLIAWARRGNARRLSEIRDAPLEERYWTANLVVSFNRPVDDLEFHVLYYDIHEGAPRFVDDMATMVSDRDQKTFVQRVRLRRPQFKPN